MGQQIGVRNYGFLVVVALRMTVVSGIGAINYILIRFLFVSFAFPTHPTPDGSVDTEHRPLNLTHTPNQIASFLFFNVTMAR